MKWYTRQPVIISTEVSFREKLEKDLVAFAVVRDNTIDSSGPLFVALYERDIHDRETWVVFARVHDSNLKHMSIKEMFNYPLNEFIVDIEKKEIDTICQFEHLVW